MTREERLVLCKRCLNRQMDAQKGLVCGLTGDIAAFENTCNDYSEDESVPLPQVAEISEAPAEQIHISEVSEEIRHKFRLHQNLIFALIGGALVMLLSAIIWAAITVATEYQIGYMAVGVGFLVGMSVRFFGAGVDPVFQYIGAFYALLGCVLGNLFGQVAFAAHDFTMSYWDTLLLLDFQVLSDVFSESIGPIDLFFYAIAIYEGYRFSIRPIPADISADSNFSPAMDRLRMPGVIICLTILGVLGYSFSKGINGPQTFYYENGMLMSEGEFSNGQLDGQWKYYNTSGRVSTLGSYDNGLENGLWTIYYESGVLNTTSNYENGLKQGWEINYHENGNLADSSYYVNGRVTGDIKMRDPNGSVYAEGRMERDQPEGTWKFYHPNGALLSTGIFTKGNRTGNWIEYDSLGTAIAETTYDSEENESILWRKDDLGSYIVQDGLGTIYFENNKSLVQGKIENGKRSGSWTEYYPDGSVASRSEWKDNEGLVMEMINLDGQVIVENGNGEYVSYHSTGEIFETGNITDGKRTGTWYVYNAEGMLEIEATYVDNKLDGPFFTYLPSGILGVDGQFKKGERSGTWTWYFNNGVVECTVDYSDGKKEGEQPFFNDTSNHVKSEFYENGELVREVLQFEG